MILTTLYTGFKLVKGFFTTYKWVVVGIAVAGMATSVFVYIDNHGEMKSSIVAQEQQIDDLIRISQSLELAIKSRNATISRLNMEKITLIADNRRKLAKANQLAQEVREQRDVITEELGILRFETLEAIRDDEDFADWVDWNVPSAGWSLLRAAAEAD